MKRPNTCVITGLLLLCVFAGFAQQKDNSPENHEKVRDLVAFLEYVLNTIGSGSTAVRDKEVLVTESYTKIFRDGKVQVEDDLDEERDAITNKDITAYLKDVDFFFKDVKFEFRIESIQEGVNANGQAFYKVSARRNLSGTTADGQQVNNTIPRFIEVNLNPADQDLKIVSIYTNEFDETEALTTWWRELSLEWKEIFKRRLALSDSVSLDQIKDIMALDTLDISRNTMIQNIDPLGQLTSLRSLNISGTTISDLNPIRNLTELTELNVSHTPVHDLAALRYSNKLRKIALAHTQVSDIAVLEKMPELQDLDLTKTLVLDFAPVSKLTQLRDLNLNKTNLASLDMLANLIQLTNLDISNTAIMDLSPLRGLTNLEILDIDSTRTRDVGPLASLEKLRILYASFTLISDLQPMHALPAIERIYCDQTRVNRQSADAFLAVNPDVLVIFDTKDLKLWWTTLSPDWQQVLTRTAQISLPPDPKQTPTNEELARVTNIDSIHLNYAAAVTDLEPLRKLQKLEVIIAARTGIHDLAPIARHTAIRHLDISETGVRDLGSIAGLHGLTTLVADRCKIDNIEPLYGLAKLRIVYIDHSPVHDIIAREFLEKKPSCLLVYKTVHLNRWWRNLSAGWKNVFRAQMRDDTTATRDNLHRLVEQESLHFGDARVGTLEPLDEFIRLMELHFSETAITDLAPLSRITTLQSLKATNSPIQNVSALADLTSLQHLDISNTPLEDLKVVGRLQHLKSLNCSGTQIKKLDPIAGLSNLEFLDCSNTRVNKLDDVMHLSLQTLKCYNTKLSSKKVETYRERNPDCEVIFYR